MYEDLRQDSAPHHILTSLLAVWKCDKAWFLLWATIANHTTSTRTFLDNLNQKLRPPLAPILLIEKMMRFGFRASSSVITGKWWFNLLFYYVQDCRLLPAVSWLFYIVTSTYILSYLVFNIYNFFTLYVTILLNYTKAASSKTQAFWRLSSMSRQ